MEPLKNHGQSFFGDEALQLSHQLVKICGKVKSDVLDQASTMVDSGRSLEETVTLTRELAKRGLQELEDKLRSIDAGEFRSVVTMILDSQRWEFREGMDRFSVETQAEIGGFPKEIREVLTGLRHWSPRDQDPNQYVGFNSDSESDSEFDEICSDDEAECKASPSRTKLSPADPSF